MKFLGKAVVILLALTLLAGAVWGVYTWQNGNGKGPAFRTDHVTRGNLIATINATGTLEPEEVIDVGAQVQGQIKKFGVDVTNSNKIIDYNSLVEEGTVLAEIDAALYAADVANARADLNVAKADVLRAQADLDAAKSTLVLTTSIWDRDNKLYQKGGAIAKEDAEKSKNAYETAKAAVPAAEANLEKSKKTVDMKEAILKRAEVNLGYCTIKSPVKGIVIDRRVNTGQTVVASLTAPSLFLIAKDLTHMQVWASVNEADVGNIHPGQPVTFTIDTYPNETFKGTVSKVRLNASMTQNVVTYTVEVSTDNPADKDHPFGKLMPYLTGNLQFKVDERKDVLLVPNAALRWRPKPDMVAPEYRDEYQQSLRRKSVSQEDKAAAGQEKKNANQANLWVEDNGFVRPIKVRVGLTDGVHTEVAELLNKDDKLDKGTPVVTGEAQGRDQASGGESNPFLPKMFGPPKKKDQ
jgi:HlyD family secretion protein